MSVSTRGAVVTNIYRTVRPDSWRIVIPLSRDHGKQRQLWRTIRGSLEDAVTVRDLLLRATIESRSRAVWQFSVPELCADCSEQVESFRKQLKERKEEFQWLKLSYAELKYLRQILRGY